MNMAQKAPELGVMAFMVWVFLKHLRQGDQVLRDISQGCHEVQRDAIAAINENSRVLASVETHLKRLNGNTKPF